MKPSKETRRVEGRGGPEGILRQKGEVRTQSRATEPGLAMVKEKARRERNARFTALLHHVDVAALERAFRRLKRGASPGVDGETVASYELDLDGRLRDLCERVHTGRYRPEPVRRVLIPKPTGGTRPLGVPTLEDKIVQGAVAEVLSAIYEVDFLGFSYGFRPRRSPHDALAALHTALMTQKVNWVLDADIRSFFDSVDHEWLLRMVEHRVADRRVLRLIEAWLKAGTIEQGEWKESERGTPQGSGISPLLANIFLHYVLDLWVRKERRTARGKVIFVRYCDDFVMGFQDKADATRMLADLKVRLEKFHLSLHEDKTRLIEFGKMPFLRRASAGERRCDTFAFLGFTHYGARTRDGRFVVKRKTEGKRLSRRLQAIRLEARKRMHGTIPVQHRWLVQVLRGHYSYYGLPSNHRRMSSFRYQVMRTWFRTLRRRGQKGQVTWPQFLRILEAHPLPDPKITHPYVPFLASSGTPSGGAGCGKSARPDLRGQKPNG
jgi:RNA-directed DNA polymerase